MEKKDFTNHTHLLLKLNTILESSESQNIDESQNIEQKKEIFFNSYYQLKKLNFESVSTDAVDLYKKLLIKSIRLFKMDKRYNTILSSSISLSFNLISAENFDNELYSLFKECLLLPDTRTKANTITAMGEFNPQSELFKEHMNSKFNRIAAEALIVEGKKKIDTSVKNKLNEFISSVNPFFVASGLYVVGKLIGYHLENKSGCEKNLIPLLSKVLNLTKHPHEMIRKRAIKTEEIVSKYQLSSMAS